MSQHDDPSPFREDLPRPPTKAGPRRIKKLMDPWDATVGPPTPKRKRKAPVALGPKALDELANIGYQHVEDAEHYNAFTGRKNDAFGCVDKWALREGEMLALQITSKANLSSRINKALESEGLRLFLSIPGHRFEAWGFYQPDGPGGRWHYQVRHVYLQEGKMTATIGDTYVTRPAKKGKG